MRGNILSACRTACAVLLLFTIVTGVAYPCAVTVLARLLFPREAHGSLMAVEGRVVGSSLIGQQFSDPQYFWGRPSATVPFACNAAASGGSNLGPTNPILLETASGRIDVLRAADPDCALPVPGVLATASGSGLDPHISPQAAECQVARVAKARGLAVEEVARLVGTHVEGRTWGVLGEPRVNVLRLNLALDKKMGNVK